MSIKIIIIILTLIGINISNINNLHKNLLNISIFFYTVINHKIEYFTVSNELLEYNKYDIKSYDLETKKEIFIEVKSVSNNSLIWTKNEVNVSREKKDQYYIYCVSFDGNKPNEISLKIKNPYKKVFIDKVYKFKEKDFTIYLD